MKEKISVIKEKVITNFKENRIPILILMLIWIITVVFTLFAYKDSLGKASSGSEFADNVVELSQGREVIETVPVFENSDVLAVKFATYARRNSGSFSVKVSGLDSDKVYADQKINVSSIQDNAFATIALSEKLDPAVDSNIRIVLSSECEENKGVGVYYSNAKVFEGSTLDINGERQEGDLSLRFLSDSEELKLFYRIVIIWVITTFSLILLMMLLLKPKYEVLFTVIAIAFGLTFWLIITPMSAPDETIHYEYSFQLSNYIMGEKDHLLFDEEYQNYGSFAGHMNVGVAYERFIKKINRPLSLEGHNVKMNYDIDESYTMCFVPQALGITVARLLNWNMLRTFYMGRLFNLIFYICCVYIAIKNAPVHKVLLGILATLPIFMQQAASFSYDCYINGLTFVSVAFLLKLLVRKEEVSTKELIAIFIANLLLAPVKVVYGLFSFLYWLVPEDRFGGKKEKKFKVLLLTAPALFELGKLLIPLIFRIIRKTIKSIIYDLNAETIFVPVTPRAVEGETYDFAYVLYHPLEAIMIILRTIRYNLKVWFYASFGRALSGNSLILPTVLVHSTLAILIAAALREEAYALNARFKLLIFAMCVFVGLMTVSGMLISWTEVNQEIIDAYGGPIVQGVQGRYFSPLLPYLLLILHNDKVKLPKKFDPYLISAFVILVFEIIVYVLSYTFING